MSVVDQTKIFAVNATMATAYFDTLVVAVVPAAGGATISFDILAGKQPVAAPGDTVYIMAMITNSGAAGNVWVTIVKDGATLWTWSGSLNTRTSSGALTWSTAGLNGFVMPSATVNITAQCGH